MRLNVSELCKLGSPAGGCAQHCCTDVPAKRTLHKAKVPLNGVGSKFDVNQT